MEKVRNALFPFYRFGNLSDCPKVLHFVSTAAKNIGYPDDESVDRMITARRELAEAVGFKVDALCLGQQVHSDHILEVKRRDAGRGAKERETRFPETDALVTKETGICLMVLAADCVPVLLCDSVRRVIAAVHAGWKGTLAGITGKTAEMMQDKFGCQACDIKAGIGPSIGKCCFEVGEEVATLFRQKFENFTGIMEREDTFGKWHIDLWEINRRQLLKAGLQEGNIEIAGLCTQCHTDEFFSYRHSGNNAGRFGAGIMLLTDDGRE